MLSKQQQQRAHAKADALTKVADISTPTHLAYDQLPQEAPSEAPSPPCVLLRPTPPTILVQVVRMREREYAREREQ